MEKNNKKCIICKKTYSYCPSCGKDNNKPSWYSIFDSVRCHEVYEICTKLRDGIYTMVEAKSKLEVLDLSDLDNFKESTQNKIREILAYEEPVVETIIESVPIQEDIVVDSTLDTIEETTEKEISKHVKKAEYATRRFTRK